MKPRHAWCAATLAILLSGGTPAAAHAFQGVSGPLQEGCQLCHGELELLRQQVPSLDRAQSLLVPPDALGSSAHASMGCATCHTGFGRFPHPGTGTATRSCASCHQEVAGVWAGSVHATPDSAAVCSSCHGVHDVQSTAAMSSAGGIRRMNGACVTCHDTEALPATDPHADTVSCAACHTAHHTQAADGPEASVAPLAQLATCGACHREVADSVRTDTHHQALVESGVASLALLRGGDGTGPPTCTSCHGAHGMLAPSHPRFDQDMVEQCAVCHESYSDTYFGTYHGKATAVGSLIVATCDRCHGSHRIFPASDERSRVAPANLVTTCGACHGPIRAEFVAYDSHPNPLDRQRDPPLFYSFVFMNVLLFGVLVVFGLHTALWWVRLILDRQRGVEHGIGGGHG